MIYKLVKLLNEVGEVALQKVAEKCCVAIIRGDGCRNGEQRVFVDD